MDYFAKSTLPFILSVASVFLIFNKNYTDAFIDGIKSGMDTTINILPTLIILMCATRMLSASGFLGALTEFLTPVTTFLHIPPEIVSIIVMRPISGSGCTALIDNLFSSSGPDSFASLCASIIMGSSDTIFFTLFMYFGAAGVKKTRYAVAASFLTLIFCVTLSVLLANLFFK